MAKLVLVTQKQYIEGLNEVGDIIDIITDEQFEKQIITKPDFLNEFEFIDTELTKTTYELLKPQTKIVFKSSTLEWTDKQPDAKLVWNDKGEWREVIFDPTYKLRWDKDLLMVRENYSRYLNNMLSPIILT